MKSPRNESENLAERLRSLYQIYNCENELPAHDDLVAKLDGVKSEVRDAVKIELDRDYVHPLSYEKALEFEKSFPLTEKFKMLYALTLIQGVGYASEKWKEKKEREEGFLWGLYAFYGGLKAIPSTVKEIFFTPAEEKAQELMEDHNKMASRYFESFKRNIDYCILWQEYLEGDQPLNSKNKVQN